MCLVVCLAVMLAGCGGDDVQVCNDSLTAANDTYNYSPSVPGETCNLSLVINNVTLNVAPGFSLVNVSLVGSNNLINLGAGVTVSGDFDITGSDNTVITDTASMVTFLAVGSGNTLIRQ
jgi:hypothetical protein